MARVRLPLPPLSPPYKRGEEEDTGSPIRSGMTEGEVLAGFRPRATRSFCFGKRIKNHGRPGVAPGGCLCPGPDCLTNNPVAGLVYVADPAASCRITLR